MSTDPSSQDQDIIDILRDLESRRAEYPPDLMAARRASFMEQVAARTALTSEDELTPREQQVVSLIKRLKSLEPDYPSILMAPRRSALRQQARYLRPNTVWARWKSALQAAFGGPTPGRSFMDLAETAVIMVGLALFAFVGLSLVADGPQPSYFVSAQDPVVASSSVPILPTSTEEAVIICKNGYPPPLCLAREFDNSYDVTYPGNGSARPAVAKDTLPGYEAVHQAAYANDGLYGPGASWVSNSPDSWIKIDLGKPTPINTVTFGRDRLGKFNDRDPGQFVISVAETDNAYADGNSSNDEVEYVEVFDSERAGFDGTISGPETVMAQFELLEARYIKISFENAGAAVDEVEAFVARPGMVLNVATSIPRGPNSHPSTPTSSATPLPTSTPIPTDTPLPTDTPTPIPADTPLPTDTPVPTDTPLPTDTPVPLPTDTPFPFETLIPFDTEEPPPTNPPAPEPLPDRIDLLVE